MIPSREVFLFYELTESWRVKHRKQKPGCEGRIILLHYRRKKVTTHNSLTHKIFYFNVVFDALIAEGSLKRNKRNSTGTWSSHTQRHLPLRWSLLLRCFASKVRSVIPCTFKTHVFYSLYPRNPLSHVSANVKCFGLKDRFSDIR